MTDLENLIQNGKTQQNKLNPKIKDADKDKKLSTLTLKQYTTTINKLYRELNIQKEINNLLWLEQYKEDITKYILTLNSPNTMKTYLSVIITLLNNDDKKYKDLINYYANISKENYDNIKIQVKKDKANDDDKIITLKEYDALIQTLSKNNYYDKEYIMFLILRYYPIRNEIGSFIYIKNIDYQKLDKLSIQSNNWILEKSKSIEMVRYKFKTAKFYANKLPFIHTIEQPVKTALKKYIKDNNITSNTPLFPIQDKPMTENQVSHRLALVSGKYLQVKISTSSIFKILACDVVKNNSNDEARKLLTHYGNIRGTNITQIIEYYVNGNKIIQDNMSDNSDNIGEDNWLPKITNVNDIYKPFNINDYNTISFCGGYAFYHLWNNAYHNNNIDGLDKLHKLALEYHQYRLNKLTIFGKGKLSYSRRRDIIIKSYNPHNIKCNH